VNPTFQLDDNITLITSINLYENYWLGDRRTGPSQAGAGSTTGDGSDNISLRQGYLQMPLAGGTLRIGRQLANWGFGLTTSNDARDRFTYLKRIGNITALAVYDKRQEGLIDNNDQDGDMIALAAIGMAGGFQWGLLVDYWDGDSAAPGGYVLENLWGIHPYIAGKAGPVGIKAAANFLFGDNKGLWGNDSIALFVRADMDFGPVFLEGQVLYVQDGGLVDTGFDTFSSLISNQSRNDVNPLNVGLNMGGLGNNGDDQVLFAVRATYSVTEEFKLIGAVGYVEAKDQYGLKGMGTDDTFLEFGFDYAVNRQVSFFGNYGIILGDAKKAKGPFDKQGLQAMGAGVRAKF
jgi:predicted porin